MVRALGWVSSDASLASTLLCRPAASSDLPGLPGEALI